MRLCLLLATVLPLLTSITALSNNVSFGQRVMTDQHLHHEVIFKKSSFMRVQSQDYVYEQKNTPYPKIITQVVVTDQYSNGKGGKCTLSSGGPGMTFVKMHCKTQRNHGFNFIIDIYGFENKMVGK